MTTIQSVVEAADFGTPTTRKTGRNPQWPYVPVIHFDGTPTSPADRVEQVKGLAYATRAEALAAAARHIEAQRADLAKKLAEPRFRALREQYGLPREIEVED